MKSIKDAFAKRLMDKLKERRIDTLSISVNLVDFGKAYVEVGVELVVFVREAYTTCYECLYEECTSIYSDADVDEKEMKKLIEECIQQRIGELDAEYCEPPFRFSYNDGKCTARLGTVINDDGIDRTYYDVLNVFCSSTIRRSMMKIDVEYETERIVEIVDRLVKAVKILLGE